MSRSGTSTPNERLWRAYLQIRRDEGMQPYALYSYRRMYERFTEFVGRTPFGEVDEETIRAFIRMPITQASGRAVYGNATLPGMEPSLSTRKNRTTYLKSLYRWLYESERIKTNPMRLVKTPKVHDNEVIIPDEGDWKTLWASELDDYDRVGFGSLYFYGLREEETTLLQARYFDGDNLVGFKRKGGSKNKPVPWGKLVRLYEKKRPELIGGSARTFTDPLERLLEKHPSGLLLTGWKPETNRPLKYDRPADFIPPQAAYRRLRRAQKRAGLRESCFTPHDCRRGCGSNLGEWGVSPRKIQEILGHEDLKTTQRYIKPQERELDALLDGDMYEDAGPYG